jgi:acetylornithine deacetylase/succinyl-diaminopimelate desuccinylase-like protein
LWPQIQQAARSEAFSRYVANLVCELCAIDTTPHADVGLSAQAEARAFDVIEREVRAARLARCSVERAPLNPQISDHPFFTPLFYTQAQGAPGGLDAERGYAGRSNLLVRIDGDGRRDGGVHQALNAHIDVVRPFFSAVYDGNVIRGRGTCDNKGNVAALLGALRLLGEHLGWGSEHLNRHLTCMFVIDEETGGNGSLSCALDRELKERYDSLLVLECTGGRLHPGNRGCVWYRIDGQLPGVNLFEAAAFIIAELEDEGRAIRAESNHPLFPHRPVQTCHGIIGDCGEHPSRINGDVSFRIEFDAGDAAERAASLVADVLADGLRAYVAVYGDKTKVAPGSTAARLDRHHDITADSRGLTVRIHGLTGHMSAIHENDGAITKMAALVRALVRSRSAIERAAGRTPRLSLAGWSDNSRLVLEGGQGFVPTHSLEDIERRVRAAAMRGLRRYFDVADVRADADRALSVSFKKLHNSAFARPVNSRDMEHAIAAARQAGTWSEAPIVGWDASCDARIFACEYPDLPIITAGAGTLQDAHSDREHIDINDVARMAEFLAYFVLRQTGTD